MSVMLNCDDCARTSVAAGCPKHNGYSTIDVSAIPPFPEATPRPWCGPVCGGRGLVRADFYGPIGVSTGVNEQTCRSCSGTGVLWR